MLLLMFLILAGIVIALATTPNSRYANDLIAATFEEASGLLYDQIYDATPTLQWLKRNQQSVPGGESVTSKLRYGESGNAKGFVTGASFTLGQNKMVTRARLPWVNYGVPVLIYDQDIMKNSGDAQIIDLAQAQKDEAIDDLAAKMAADLYATSYTDQDEEKFPSLLIMTDATSTIGGISSTTYSWWSAVFHDGSASDVLSIGLMEEHFNTCGRGKAGMLPDQLFGAQNMVESYKTLAGPFGAIQLGTGPANNRGADLGFERVWFRGRPFDMDMYAPDGEVLMLNSKLVKLVAHVRNATRVITEVKPVSATPGATEHTLWGMWSFRIHRRASLGRLHDMVAVS